MEKTIRVLIADDSEETRRSLRNLLSLETDIAVVGEAGDGHEAVAKAGQLRPHLVLMDIRMPGMDGIAATEAITAEYPTVQTVIMSVMSTSDLLRRAMLAGAREYLVKPFEPEELVATVRRVHGQFAQPDAPAAPEEEAPAPRRGVVLAVFGPKGGVGRTTVACNLAAALAADADRRVIVVDNCLRFGDVGMALNLRSDRSLADIVGFPADEIDAAIIDGLTVDHPSGLRALLAPPKPDGGEMLSPAAIRRVLLELRQAYDYVVVDMSPALLDTDLAAMDLADKILVLYSLEMTAIKDAKLFLELAPVLGYPADKLVFAANKVDTGGGMRLADVEAHLHFQTAVSLPNDVKLATFAMNKGIPFVLSSRETALSRGIVELAQVLAGPAAEAAGSRNGKPKKASPLQSLFAKR